MTTPRTRRSCGSPTTSPNGSTCSSPSSSPNRSNGDLMSDDSTVNVRILVDDVEASVDFYTRHFGFTVLNAFPAFADVQRGNLRLLLSGPQSSAARPMADGAQPGPGGWNRIHFIVDDLDAEIAELTA